MRNLFAYGTLMCEDVLQAVIGKLPAQEPALLQNYSRKKVKGQPFPAIIPNITSHVFGTMYFDIPYKDWLELDRFEGPMYERKNVEIELVSGRTMQADVYVVKTDYIEELEEKEWDLNEFRLVHKKKYLQTL